MRGRVTAGRISPAILPAIGAIVIVLQVASILWFPQFPTVEGPAYKYGAWAYRQLTIEAASPLGWVFEAREDWSYPGAAYSWYLVRAQDWMSVDQAERIGLLLYLAGLLSGFGYLIRSFGQLSWEAVVLLLALTLNYLFFMGFVDFLWGVPFALVAVGSLQRFTARGSWWNVLLCNLALALAWWCHLFSFLLAVFAMLALTALQGQRFLVRKLLATVPAMVLAVLLWPRSSNLALDWLYLGSLGDRAWRVLSLRVATAFGGAEVVVAAALGLALLFAAAVLALRHREESSVKVLAVLVLVMLIVAVAVPRVGGTGTHLDDRVALYFWLMVLVLVAHRASRLRTLMSWLAILVAAVHLSAVVGNLRQFNRQYAEFIAGVDSIPDESPVFVYQLLERERPGEVQLWKHAQARYSLALGAADFQHLPAATRRAAFSPLHYTPAAEEYYAGERPAMRIGVARVARFAPFLVFWGDMPDYEAVARNRLRYRPLFASARLQVYEQPRKALFHRLAAARDESDAEASDRLLEWIQAVDGLPVTTLSPSGVLGVNFVGEGWIPGTGPVAILLRNDSQQVLARELDFKPFRDRSRLPVTLSVKQGGEVLSYRVETLQARRVRLRSVAPGQSDLALVWTDKCSQQPVGGARCVAGRITVVENAKPAEGS